MTHHRPARRRTALRAAALGAAAALGTALLPGTAVAADPSAAAAAARAAAQKPPKACEERNNNTYQKLLDCVTLGGVLEHAEAFQRIAEESDDPVYPGSRAAGTDGYADTVQYVSDALVAAGYDVSFDPVDITFNFPAVLNQLTPVAATYATGVFTGSGNGTIEAGTVVPVDINLTPPRASTSGCEAADFAGYDWSGPADIALVQRGTCFFGDKAYNAEQAGAEAVIIFNQGNTPDREGLVVADATSRTDPANPTGPALVVEHTIPVVGASFADGAALAQAGSTADVQVLPAETRSDVNVIAEKAGKNTDNVVMAGAHIDSVTDGSGMSDNGFGAAALLETALAMGKVKPQNSIRFAFWAGEEQGLLGSADYVAGLPQAELDRIALYMNYDMIGSPNSIFMVYDADESTFEAPVEVPAGSEAIEDLYERYYTKIGRPYDDTEFSGRSDYEAFILNGIPSSGLFTGAEVPKTEEQAAIWGGTAGDAFDPCYHQACDDIDNVNLDALEVNSDVIAFAMLTFAYDTRSVNGVEGRRVPGPRFDLPEPAGPEGTFATEGGGGGPASPVA